MLSIYLNLVFEVIKVSIVNILLNVIVSIDIIIIINTPLASSKDRGNRQSMPYLPQVNHTVSITSHWSLIQ